MFRRAATLLLGLALCGPAFAAGSLRILTPVSGRPALGPTAVALQVQTPEGAAVSRVVVELDGKQVALLTSPPWTAIVDLGTGETERVLGAVSAFSDGTFARAQVRIAAVRIQETAEVSLVSFYATVRDESGALVNDLKVSDFQLTENGRAQKIERFSTERRPLRAALVLDTSESMNTDDRIGKARAAAIRFLETLAPEDEVALLTFSDAVHLVHPMTSDLRAIRAAIEGMGAKGGTALYDAIWKASELLSGEDGRKVLVLLSDGKDEAQSGIEPGSLHTMNEALQRALRDEVMIFAIGIGRWGTEQAPEADPYTRMPLRDILNTLGSATGGEVLFLSRPRQLAEAFERVAEALRNQYAVAYTSDDQRKDGSWRETRLTALRKGLTVTARRGYYAPKQSPRASG
ncbi:MAG TPA: VWA domain-containing protein [Candidatus Polarisedimenticolaceae bacterium]|nr:VWA domain-containing protein [Candidatus Polarisedimenticolaceae bacterium]